MAKINPKAAKAMYEAGMEANKEKIAKETYGEFGFDTLTYDQQQEVYKKYPKIQKTESDKSYDFEQNPINMKSSFKLPHQSPAQFKGANSSNSSCWKGYKKVGTKPSPSGTGETVNDCEKI